MHDVDVVERAFTSRIPAPSPPGHLSAAVLVEAPAVVGAGEGDDAVVQLGQPAAGRNRLVGVDGVGVVHPVDDRARVDDGVAVQSDDVGRLDGRPGLQPVHVVADQHGLGGRRAVRQPVVPGRLGVAGHRQHRGVGVQRGRVPRVADRAQHVALGRGRRRAAGPAPGPDGWRRPRSRSGTTRRRRRGLHALGATGHRAHRAGGVHRGQALGRPFDVAGRAADDGVPGRAAGDREHAVVGQEREQVARRVVAGPRRRRRPDGRDHRSDEVGDEVAAEPVPVQELAQRGL